MLLRSMQSFVDRFSSLNQDLATSDSWCLKCYMRLNLKKTEAMVVSRSRTNNNNINIAYRTFIKITAHR